MSRDFKAGCRSTFTAVANAAMAIVAGRPALFVAHKKAHKTVDLGRLINDLECSQAPYVTKPPLKGGFVTYQHSSCGGLPSTKSPLRVALASSSPSASTGRQTDEITWDRRTFLGNESDRKSLTDVLTAAADSPLLRAECG